MSNITNNRLNFTFTTPEIEAVGTLVTDLNTALNRLIGLTVEERSSLPKMSVVNRAFVSDALEVLNDNPSLFPGYLDSALLTTDLQLFDQLSPILSRIESISEKLRDTQILAGSEAYVTALAVYRIVQASAAAGIPGTDALYDLLKARFEGQGSTPTPPTP